MNNILRNTVFTVLFLCSFYAGAQELSSGKRSARKAYAEANDKYYTRQYDLSLKALDRAISKDKTFSEAYWFKANIYEINREYDLQIETLQQADNPKYPYYNQTLIYLGQALFNEGQYAEAKKNYEKLAARAGTNTRLTDFARSRVDNCDFAIELVANPVPFQPENLGPEVNTPYDDYWPVVSADEKRLITTVLVENKVNGIVHYQEDFYQSVKENGTWGKSQALDPPINSPNNEGAQSLSPDGKVLFFSACNRAEGSGKCDIFVSFYTGNGWSEPINPGSPLNTSAWEAHPSMSSNGKTLYFCSNRPGSLGKRDIWIAELDLSTPGEVRVLEVRNAGPVINTEEDEVSPYIHFDDQTLYFSSDGHPGLGRHDIFMSRKDMQSNWQNPQNIGYPINTHRDEIGFTVNALGTRAYFSSEAETDDRTDKDIYAIPLPGNLQPIPVTYLKGTIFDADSHKPLIASFQLTDLEVDEPVSNSQSLSDGTFLLCLPAGRDYALNVSKAGYLFYSDRFTLKEQQSFSEPEEKNIPLIPIKTGSTIELKNIYFEFDSFELMKTSFSELRNIVALLKNNPEMVVEIGGHTDGKGGDAYNKTLSLNRAKSVLAYLLDAGIHPDRLRAKGYGFDEPQDAENPYSGVNRRTELKVMEM